MGPLLSGVLEDRCPRRTLTGWGICPLQPPRKYLFVDLPKEVDLISQPFQAGLQFHLVHICFIHILKVR